jgi:hypothetical protein
MNKTDFIKKYGNKKTSSFGRWILLKFFNYDHDSRIAELRPKVVSAYKAMKLKQGELFEDKMIPMDESDLSDIERGKKKSLSIITYIALILIVTFILLYIYTGGPTADDILMTVVVGLLFVFLTIGSYVLTIKNYDQVLSLKTKRIVKGVITDILHTEEEGPAFEISDQEMVVVFTKEYRKFLPGDIVSIVIFSERDTWMKRHIKKIGNLFDHDDGKPTVANTEFK